MPHDLCRFSYFSTPVGVNFEQDIVDIVAVASKRNPQLGLTGVIAIENGRFHQILERSFGNWSMHLVSSTQMAQYQE